MPCLKGEAPIRFAADSLQHRCLKLVSLMTRMGESMSPASTPTFWSTEMTNQLRFVAAEKEGV